MAYKWMAISVAATCLVLLIVMIASSPARLCYDEIYHLELARSVREKGWQLALTSQENQSAVGPLYPALHLALAPLTGMRAPAVRCVNLFCLLFVLFLLGKQVREASDKKWVSTFSILSVPFLWPAAGMALTELPALIFFTGFMLAFTRMLDLPDTLSVHSLALAAMAGLCLGISILGRQTYLAAALCVAAMAIWTFRKWPLLFVCLALAALVCAWLFVLWGGFLPLTFQSRDSGFRLSYLVLSLGYTAGATLFLNPRWMKPRSSASLVGCSAVGLALAIVAITHTNPPAKSLLFRIFPEQIGLLVGLLISSALIILGALWAWNAFQEAWQARHNPHRIFEFLILFALMCVPVKVAHQFSSRYLVGMLGVLFITNPPAELGSWWALRMIGGSVAGATMLWTYFR